VFILAWNYHIPISMTTICQQVHRNLSGFLCWIVKQSHYRTGQAQRVSGGWGSQVSRQAAYEGGKNVSPTHWPSLSPGNIPRTHFCESTPGPWCGRKDYVNEKFQWHHRKSNSRPSGSWHSASTNGVTVCLLFAQLNTLNKSITHQ